VLFGLAQVDSGRVSGRVTTERWVVPEAFGDFEGIQVIGSGGTGLVCRARQVSLHRFVALKIIRQGEFLSAEAVRRFHLEAESAARLDHPNIVPIFEVGQNGEFHYFSMRLIEGTDLATEVGSKPMADLRRIAVVLMAISDAVHHAHQRGIIHRDLKPANILLDESGQPHVADFGVSTGLGVLGGVDEWDRIAGTPAFMAPEQTDGQNAVTTACDVYGLGAILFALLTGRPPYLQGKDEPTRAFLSRVRDEATPDPRAFRTTLELDLAAICLKCLSKLPQARYASAQALREDLGRWLAGLPVDARPIQVPERVWKWVARNPATAAAAGLASALAVLGLIGVVGYSYRTGRLNRELSEATLRLGMERIEDSFVSGDSSLALAQLVHLARANPDRLLIARRLFSAIVHRRYGHPEFPAITRPEEFTAAKFTSDSQWIVTMSGDSDAEVFGAETGDIRATYPGYGFHFNSISVMPDGPGVVTGLKDGVTLIWNPEDGRILTRLERHRDFVESTDVSPDGRRVVTGSKDGTGRVWDAMTGAPLTPFLRHSDRVRFVQFSPGGDRVVTASYDGTARIWDAATGESVGEPLRHSGGVESAIFSSDGTRVVTAMQTGAAQLWDAVTGHPLGLPMVHGERVRFAGFSPDGAAVATASVDGTARLWNGCTGLPETAPLRHRSGVVCLDFSPDGRWLLTGSHDATARVWDAHQGTPVVEPLPCMARVRHVEFDPTGQKVIAADERGYAQVWRVGATTSSKQWPHGSPIMLTAISSNGKRVATASRDGSVRVWETETGAEICPPLRQPLRIDSVRFDRGGDRLLVSGHAGVARLWNVTNGALLSQYEHETNRAVWRSFWDSSEQRIVTCSDDGRVHLWDAGGQRVRTFEHAGSVEDCSFSPDEALLLSACDDGAARLWDVVSGRMIGDHYRHGQSISAARFSRDGQRIVTASRDGTAKIWSVAKTDSSFLAVLQHRSGVLDAQFSPDGTLVLTWCYDNIAYLWREVAGTWVARPIHHEGPVRGCDFGSDGSTIITACGDGNCRVWDVASGLPCYEAFKHPGAVVSARMSLDGSRLVTASGESVHVWSLPEPIVPLPGWLLDLGESLAGSRIDERLGIEKVTSDGYFKAKAQVAASSDRSAWMEACREFFGLPRSQ